MIAKTETNLTPTHVRMLPAGESIQEDGARWQLFEDSSDPERFTVLTSVGFDLLSRNRGARHDIYELMNNYRAAELGSTAIAGEDPEIRKKLGTGFEAKVYSMGPYAIREVPRQKGFYSVLGELQRMNALNSVVEGGLPRWLLVPTHYAAHVDTRSGKTYTVMDKINGGLTVADIENYPDTEKMAEYRVEIVEAALGAGITDAKEKVPKLFAEAKAVLEKAIKKAGKDPKDYLVDWAGRNVVVEPLQTPVAGSNYRLAVIDQYKELD